MASLIREVFSERNILVLAIYHIVTLSFMLLRNRWWSLYQLGLGATPAIVGFTAMIEAIVLLLFQIPSGILADKFGRKKMLIYGFAIRPISALVWIFARTWQQLIPGIIFESAGMSLSMPAYLAIVADSLPPNKRGTSYGAYTLVTQIPTIYMPVLSGIYMDRIGLVNGMMTGFHLYLIAFTVVTIFLAKFLKETLKNKVIDRRAQSSLTFKESLNSLSKIRGSLLAMLLVSVFARFSIRLIMPFETIYAVNVKGFTKTQWGLVGTVMGIISVSCALPGGMISDRFGRRFSILIARVMMPLKSLGLVLLPEFSQVLLLNIGTSIGDGLGGTLQGPLGGPAWQALIADLVPSKDRGKVRGFIATITGMMGLPAPVTGGYLYNDVGPDNLFLINVLINLIPISLMYFIREPKIREK